MRKCFLFLVLLFCLPALLKPLGAQRLQLQERSVVFIPFSDAQQIVASLNEVLPAGLKGKGDVAIVWPTWVARHDAEIRSRLARGDEDSVINFLLFGTSFTKEPRLSLEQLQQLKSAESAVPNGINPPADRISSLVAKRESDLVNAAVEPHGNDRLLFASKILSGAKGSRLLTQEGREQAKQNLRAALQRVMTENTSYARALEGARLQGNASEEFAERSRLFRTRGLSSDTSLLPNFALEESLKEIKGRSLLAPHSVKRVAVIGPGLDFTDKQEGYDFYPQQTIQPFAIMDALLRLGLADASALEVTTLDLSPRVNDHLSGARRRAQRGQSYVVQLPRDLRAGWKPDAIAYWERFGDQIGQPVAPVAVPVNLGQLKLRAVRIRPAIVSRVRPVDANIVLQRLDLGDAERFDLIIATNIFVYYDTLDQSLAVMNVQQMLRRGGILLSNNALLELPFFQVHSIGYSTVAYSERENDGDHVVWYRRALD